VTDDGDAEYAVTNMRDMSAVRAWEGSNKFCDKLGCKQMKLYPLSSSTAQYRHSFRPAQPVQSRKVTPAMLARIVK
jgi:hypothetical protein